MAEEKKDEGGKKLSPPTIKAVPKKTGSVFGWARNTHYYFFILIACGSILSKSYSTYKEVEEIWVGKSTQETVAKSESVNHARRKEVSCNGCNECVEIAIGQKRTRVSLTETFPGYRKRLRVCDQDSTFTAFVKRGDTWVTETFGPNSEFTFTSEDREEFYLVGKEGSAVTICKSSTCNN